MWNDFLIMLGVRQKTFGEILQHDLDAAFASKLEAQKSLEHYKHQVNLYNDRIKRIQSDLKQYNDEKLTQTNGG